MSSSPLMGCLLRMQAKFLGKRRVSRDRNGGDVTHNIGRVEGSIGASAQPCGSKQKLEGLLTSEGPDKKRCRDDEPRVDEVMLDNMASSVRQDRQPQ